jgi:hypothetical protein
MFSNNEKKRNSFKCESELVANALLLLLITTASSMNYKLLLSTSMLKCIHFKNEKLFELLSDE